MFQLPEILEVAGGLVNVEGLAKKEGVLAKNEGVWAKSEKVAKNAFLKAKM